MKLIDIVTSIFITFGGFTIDRRMSGIDNTLDEGNLNVILIDLEHRQSCQREQRTDGNKRCNRRERFKIVDTEYLREAFSN
jgi:hypothetical protein